MLTMTVSEPISMGDDEPNPLGSDGGTNPSNPSGVVSFRSSVSCYVFSCTI